MTTTVFRIKGQVGDEIGVVHIPLYEKWGKGRTFARPPYSMTQDERALKKIVAADSRGAHLLAAVQLTKHTGRFYQWRQRVQITNEKGSLVDIADYDQDRDGKPDAGRERRVMNWALDCQNEREHEWYWASQNRLQAVYKNRMYWDTQGQPMSAELAARTCLFEDNPNQPMQLLGAFGPFGTFGEIKKNPTTGIPLARELNKQLRVKFSTALIETKSERQPGGGFSVLRFTWGFYIDHDGAWHLYPLKRDESK